MVRKPSKHYQDPWTFSGLIVLTEFVVFLALPTGYFLHSSQDLSPYLISRKNLHHFGLFREVSLFAQLQTQGIPLNHCHEALFSETIPPKYYFFFILSLLYLYLYCLCSKLHPLLCILLNWSFKLPSCGHFLLPASPNSSSSHPKLLIHCSINSDVKVQLWKCNLLD